MPVFPKREAEILELAQHIISGLGAGASDFPAPPISVANLQAALDAAKNADDAAIAAHAAAETPIVWTFSMAGTWANR
jgi:hypothetical protein